METIEIIFFRQTYYSVKSLSKYKALLLLLIISVALSAQVKEFSKNYLLSYPQTSVSAATATFHWTDKEWQAAGKVLFIGSSLYLFDAEIRKLIQNNKSNFTAGISQAGKQFGEGKYLLPALGVTCLGGCLLKSDKTKDTALLSLKSFLLANGLTTSLKYLTQRERPFREAGKGFWNGEGFSRTRDSFPSGHATVIWSVVPILAQQYKDTKWVPPVAYTVAVLTSLSRLHDDKHWASDVFAGSAIGYLTARLVLKTTPRLEVSPLTGSTGVSLIYHF